MTDAVARPSYRLGIDIGGTFTDLALIDDSGGVAVLKVPSTPDDYARGVMDGVQRLLEAADRGSAGAREVAHGTTVATNTLLEGRGARTGLLTTAGFRDILEIRRMRVPRLYDLSWEKPAPLVPRARRLEVDERLDHTGRVLRPLDERGARDAIARLLDEGVEAIAVCLLHSYANPVHEARLGELLAELAPNVYWSLSHQVLPQIQEYERTSTTAINACLGPTIAAYLERMERELAALGIRAPLLVMQSNGGTSTASSARRLPAQLVESGPAAGVTAAAALDPSAGLLLTLDMGGTTAKAALVRDGRVPLVGEAEIGAGVTVANRLNRGGGYVLALPSVDLVEVGAGGGSLVQIDPGGGVRVGPESAGASPGPVCYAAGGTTATLTDANVVLGYLNPTHLLGGALALDAGAARRAVEDQLARPLGLSLEEAARGARAVGVASMVRAVRAVSAERGHDPRAATLVAFGGNGPLHAAAVADELGIPRIVVPAHPGVFSAFGLLAAHVEHHYLRTHLRLLRRLEPDGMGRLMNGMATQALETLSSEGYLPEHVELMWSADLRYLGQSFELNVAFESGSRPEAIDRSTLAALEEGFGAAHERTYGHRAEAEAVELVNVRLAARGVPDMPRGLPAPRPSAGAAAATQRHTYWGRPIGWQETPVLARADLGRAKRRGPLVVEEYDATTLVPPDWSAFLDDDGRIILERAR